MFKIGGAMKGQRGLLLSLAFVALSQISHAATVGQWSGNASNTVWAASGTNFSSFYAAATATGVGHTIETPEQITASSLANNTHFIISAPSSLPTAQAITALRDWVLGGGILLLMVDPSSTYGGNTSAGIVNQILAQMGSTMTAYTGYPVGSQYSYAAYGQLQGTNVPVNGAGGNLSGLSLSSTAFNPLGGGAGFGTSGSALNNLVRVGGLTANGTPGIGQIYLFGNAQMASNTAITANSNNRTFFLNLLGQNLGGFPPQGPTGPTFDDSPEPATVSLMVLGLGGLVWYRRRKTQA
jgi:hypothetical protein